MATRRDPKLRTAILTVDGFNESDALVWVSTLNRFKRPGWPARRHRRYA